MMQRPWECAQPDEWLPRNLRLCWGSESGSGTSSSGSEGGGFDGGAFTGGGDWGSSGSFDASSFNAGGDLAAGMAFDAGFYGHSGGGDWSSFGPTSYGSFDAPNPTFADVLGPNPGVTTGGGDWGSAGAFSAAGTGGGPGGAMVGDIGGGGGVFGDYGGGQIGGGGGYTGGQIGGQIGGGGGGGGYTGGGGRGGDGPFGANFGGEGGGRGYAGSPTASPGWAPAAPGPSLSSPYGDDTGPEGRGEQEGPPAPAPEATPEALAPEATPEATPEAANPPGEAPPSQDAPSAAPAGRGIGSDIVASPESKSAAPTAFGPQSIDYEGSPYADMGPQTDWGSVFEGAAPPDTTDTTDWGSVFEGAAPPGEVGKWSDLPGIFSTGISNTAQSIWDAIQSRGRDAPAWNEIGTWFSPLNQKTINELSNLPNTLNPNNWVDVQSRTGMPYGQPSSPLDQQALGEQGKAGQLTDLATQLGTENISPTPDTTDWGSVFEAPAQAPNYAAVFEAPAQDPDYASMFEGAPTSPDWTSVFEGAAPDPGTEQLQTDRSGIEAYIPGGRETDFEYASNAPAVAPPSYDTTMESGPPGARTSTDNALTPGGDPALSGLPADPAAAAAAGGRPGALPAGTGPTYVTETAVTAAANAASNAAQTAGANPLAGDAASQAAYNAALNLASPTEQASAAMAAALENGATQEQADAIAAAVLDAASSQSGFTPGPTPGQQQQAPPGPLTPGAPLGPQPTQETTPPQQGTPPSLVEMAQQGQSGRSETFIPGGRITDFNYTPSSTPSSPPAANLPPAAPPPDTEDHDAPEPMDSSLPPQDPNAPRPPGNIPAQPGQLLGARGTYDNPRASTPQTSRTYRDSGRIDYPQGRPGITWRSARQAGIEPLFRTEDINTYDLSAPLIENLNRALRAMEQRTGIPASSLVATSAYRAAHRGEALEHGMDERTAQEDVYSRSNPKPGFGKHFPAAQPGNSNHGPGRAIDFASSPARAWLRANAREFGLETLGGTFDMPHIQLQSRIANVRPSEQEQREQRAIDAQNRQAAIDRGLIGGGRGQAPAQQAGVPTPPARPTGIETGIDPGAEQYASEPLAPSPPAAALPPADLPPETLAPRPPADIPPPALVPPARGQLDRATQTQNALNLIKQSTAKLTTQSGQAEFNAAGVVAAKGLAAAGVPLAMARSLMTQSAYQGAEKVGYGPSSMGWSLYKGHIDAGIEAALQGYQPARPGEVQGPPSVRGLAKGGHVDEDEPVVVGEKGPEYFVPDRPGTVYPHQPQPGQPGNIDRWPKVPAVGYPGQYGGIEREIRRQLRTAQDPVPSLMDMIDSGRLRLNAANWNRMLNDPDLIALGRSRMEDRR